MVETEILLDAFTRVYESLHRTLPDLTATELIQEPHPPIGWLAWRISRVMDSNASRPGAAMDRRWLGRSIWHASRARGLWAIGQSHARTSASVSRLSGAASDVPRCDI